MDRLLSFRLILLSEHAEFDQLVDLAPQIIAKLDLYSVQFQIPHLWSERRILPLVYRWP